MPKARPSKKARPANLRALAESALRATRTEVAKMPRPEVQRLINELQVHQIELEMQNEELREAQSALAHSRDRFNDLYDFAPVGFLTLDHDGTVIEANLTAAMLLGVERQNFVGRKFTRFVTPGSQDAFYLHRQAVVAAKRKKACDLELRRKDGAAFFARMETIHRREAGSGAEQFLCAIIDITERKRAEKELARSHAELEQRVEERTAELRESERTARAVVDALSGHIAIVDERGVILAVNLQWQQFAKGNGAGVHAVGAGANYLAVCDAAGQAPGSEGAAAFAQGIREVLAGRRREFVVETPCHSPTEDRWFLSRVTPFPGKGLPRAVISHENITSRVNAEEAMRREKELYRQLVQALPAAVCTCDAQGRLTLYNAAAVTLWGGEPSRASGRWGGSLKIFTPDGRRIPRAELPLAVILKTNKPIRNAEFVIERPDGGRTDVLTFASPLQDGSGAAVGGVGIMVDITEQKQAEEALRTSERKLRMLSRAVEQSPASVLITNLAGEIVYVNPKFTELTGYALAEVLGKNPRLLKSGQQPPEVYRSMWETITAGRDWRGELCNRKKSGELYWEFAVIAPIHDEHGKLTHFVAIKEDITERRRVALELHDRRERLRAILNTVVDAVLTIDRRGVINSVNPATERLFGYTEAEMVGQNVSMLMPAPYRQEHDQYLENYHRTGHAQIIGIGREVQAQRKNGSVFPIELAVSEIDHMHMFTGVIRDITERKRLETEVLRIAEAERLRVAADLHDGICQELVGLQYLANMLRRDLEKAKHPLAAQAKRSEEAIILTTDHTRQAARGMNPVVADGTGLMHSLRNLAATTASTRRIRCSFECNEPVLIENPTVANELYRIAQEAVLNALRHGEAKRVAVRLCETSREVCLAVIDNGKGFTENPVRSAGMGLRVMKYRAGVIGGHLIVQPRRGGGVEVTCCVAKPFSKP